MLTAKFARSISANNIEGTYSLIVLDNMLHQEENPGEMLKKLKQVVFISVVEA